MVRAVGGHPCSRRTVALYRQCERGGLCKSSPVLSGAASLPHGNSYISYRKEVGKATGEADVIVATLVAKQVRDRLTYTIKTYLIRGDVSHAWQRSCGQSSVNEITRAQENKNGSDPASTAREMRQP